MDFEKLINYTRSEEGKRHYARIVTESRIDSITYGIATGNLDLEEGQRLLKELFANKKEVK